MATTSSRIELFVMDRSVERELECPMCFEILGGQIMVCKEGHSFCSQCIVQVPNCPMCKVTVTPETIFRNLEMESRIQNFNSNCSSNDKNSDDDDNNNIMNMQAILKFKTWCCNGCKGSLSRPIYLLKNGYNYCESCSCDSNERARNYLAETLLEHNETSRSTVATLEPKFEGLHEPGLKCLECDYYADERRTLQTHILISHKSLVKRLPKVVPCYLLRVNEEMVGLGKQFLYHQSVLFLILYKVAEKDRLFVNVNAYVDDYVKYIIKIGHKSLTCNNIKLPEFGVCLTRDECKILRHSGYNVKISFV